MEAKTDRLSPSAPIGNINLEQRLEEKINDVNSSNNSINNIKQMITYFKAKNTKSKKKYVNYKPLTTILKGFDTIGIIATRSYSITLKITGIGLIVLLISTTSGCALSIGNNVLYGIIINKYNKYRKHYEKDQKIIKSFDKLYRKSLQEDTIDKSEYEKSL